METDNNVQGVNAGDSQSLGNVVSETSAEVSELEGAKSGSDQSALKGKEYKHTASERVRQAINQKNEAESRAAAAETKMAEAQSVFQGEIQELKNSLREINERLKSGDITRVEADKAKSQAKVDFDEALDDVDISDDIKPYKNDIVKIAQKIAKSMIYPYEQKINEYESERVRLQQDRVAQEKEEWTSNLKSSYLDASKEFPDIFEEAKEEGGLPELKPEYDERARKIAAMFNMPYQDENGVTIIYNPLLSSADGLKLIFSYVSGQTGKAETAIKAKAEISKVLNNVADTKRSKVETPYSPNHSAQKKETLHDIVNNAMKELGM